MHWLDADLVEEYTLGSIFVYEVILTEWKQCSLFLKQGYPHSVSSSIDNWDNRSFQLNQSCPYNQFNGT